MWGRNFSTSDKPCTSKFFVLEFSSYTNGLEVCSGLLLRFCCVKRKCISNKSGRATRKMNSPALCWQSVRYSVPEWGLYYKRCVIPSLVLLWVHHAINLYLALGYNFSYSRRPQELQIRVSRCNFSCTKTLTVDSVYIQTNRLVCVIQVYVYYYPWDLTARINVSLTFHNMIDFLTGGLVNYEKEGRAFSVDS